jgi:hypothetical protein
MPPRAPTRVGSLLRKKLVPGTWDDFFRFEFQHKRKKCRRVPSALFLDYPFSSSHASRLDRRCPGRVHGGRRRCDLSLSVNASVPTCFPILTWFHQHIVPLLRFQSIMTEVRAIPPRDPTRVGSLLRKKLVPVTGTSFSASSSKGTLCTFS